MQRNQNNPTSSGETERAPSSELARMLEERGIPGPAQAAVQPEWSLASSGATNPFTPSELAWIYNDGRVGTTAPDDQPQDAPEQELRPVLQPSVRIIVEYSHPISVNIAPFGHTDSAADVASRQVCVSLDPVQSGRNSFRKLAVTQSKKDLGVSTEAVAAASTAAKLLNCKLSFDLIADRVIVMNCDLDLVTARMRAAEGGGGYLPQSKQLIEFKPYLVEILECGSWAIFAASGQHVLDLSLLPRRNISIVRTPNEPIGSALQGPKRKYELSQLTGAAKRGKLEGGDVLPDRASIIFQPAPEPSAAGTLLLRHGLVPAPRSPVTEVEGSVAIAVRHPLEDLRVGDIAKIIGPDGEDSTLTYDKTISPGRNSHVFRAQYSSLSEGFMVVKVVRSPSGPAASGGSGEVANKVQKMAEVWLREVKVHSQLSQHVGKPKP